MAYTANPFLERMSERTTSEQDFVHLFSPKVISQVGEAAFRDGISIFTSSPGAGKTTLLRAFTPSTLKAFWNTRPWPEPSEAYSMLHERGIIDGVKGPLLLGVLLTCASGYADLPRGVTHAGEGLFRALMDCRVVLRDHRQACTLTAPPNAEVAFQHRFANFNSAFDVLKRLCGGRE